MTRRKVKLAFIVNESARKTTYRKRKNGMVKKANELATLCGVEACMIIYSPYDTEPEVWPSSMGVQSTLVRFRQMPEMEQCKKMMNQMSFTRERIQKISEQVKKMRRNNREKELAQIMYHYLSSGIFLQNMTMNDLHDLSWLIGQNLRDISRRMEALEMEPQNEVQIQSQGQEQAGEDNNNGKGIMEMNISTLQRQQNFMELMNCAGDETLPFGEANLCNAWSSPFYF
ncbi:agamous-like MADS-box protein AGL80 [Neltuma alba]|uniref:agamous-like MADS-box protein AGL80 n=1 Tax=Neltuma alba TaxID=207710 RepID=UPI0010A39098|nr:agamous-like MADS-box protein AGL80 [Prosopis alba]